MARATRSSAQHGHDPEKQSDYSLTSRAKAASKKRKRTSIADIEDQPATKQLRNGDFDIKEEGSSQEPEGIPPMDKLPELQNAADAPINDADAQKILDILEMCFFDLFCS
jgi:hypothetical protein